MDDNLIPFPKRVRQLLKERDISPYRFEIETGIARQFFYKKDVKKHNKATMMAIAYYLNMRVEELVDGTDAMEYWYC
jgi:hypothetical protein